jgi:DNA-directed RNA polymerase subunit RPC12/RpoP
MKGKTTCPQCNHEFVVDVPDTAENQEITCPECNHTFVIRCTPPDQCTEEDWEEHGEPRKTVLSALKPRTNKPIIASFLLLTVCVLGIFNAVFEFHNQAFIPYLTPLSGILANTELTAILIVFSGFALVGAVTTFKRRFFELTIIGAFLGIFSFGFIVGSALSIAALALIILSRDEFENATKGKIF